MPCVSSAFQGFHHFVIFYLNAHSSDVCLWCVSCQYGTSFSLLLIYILKWAFCWCDFFIPVFTIYKPFPSLTGGFSQNCLCRLGLRWHLLCILWFSSDHCNGFAFLKLHMCLWHQCIVATIRYDTRCYFNVRSKANMSQLNLPHGTDN